MRRDFLLKLHLAISIQAAELMRSKNLDYASDEDALSNFKEHGCYGIATRLNDKVCRLTVLSKKPPTVIEETIEDTCLDIINYAVLYLAKYSEDVLGRENKS